MGILDDLANFTTDLLEYDPEKVIIGYTNYDRQDTQADYIVIYNIVNTPIATTKLYNGDDEVMNIKTTYVADCQMQFYGVNALDNATKWKNLVASEKSFELQSQLGVKLFTVTTFNHLGIADGTNYDELYQSEFKARYAVETSIPTLRIDTAQTQFYNS